MHYAIPTAGLAPYSCGERPAQPPLAQGRRDILLSGLLFALLTTLTNFINAGMSAHMISILAALGIGSALAVWIAALRGVGQCAARLMEVFSGRAVDPLALNLAACLLLPLSFAIGLAARGSAAAAVAFSLLYGAANGLLTITRGTLPLALFDHRSYGGMVGRLVAPGFLFSAAAPVLYAWLMQGAGAQAGLWLSAACALAILLSAAALWRMFRNRNAAAIPTHLGAK
ncbi:MAG: hypothetical protein GAK35_01486 [Herbaspirillum frisingense]|uniref:MFS transporter n=1 Tax=Herbaspirillum frisingense TaxID=92645 RepID=A0A7V8FXW2_9BURK|nr:MAG: hypothetical protein GAK35_01486 [Herbaspirillum frisingense]